MITSVMEYHLLSELISMPDRELAKKIELVVFCTSHIPQPHILGKFLAIFKASDGPEQFYLMAQQLVEETQAEFFEAAEIKTQPLKTFPFDPHYAKACEMQEALATDETLDAGFKRIH